MRAHQINWIFFPVISVFVLSYCNSPEQYSGLNYSSKESLITSAKASINEISISDLKGMMDVEEMYTLIDVRTPGENQAGYISGSVNIPRGFLEFRIEDESFWDDEGMYVPLKEDKLILFCRSGSRSALSAFTLDKMGFENVYSLKGGFKAWKEAYPELTNLNSSLNTSSAQVPMGTADEEDAGGC